MKSDRPTHGRITSGLEAASAWAPGVAGVSQSTHKQNSILSTIYIQGKLYLGIDLFTNLKQLRSLMCAPVRPPRLFSTVFMIYFFDLGQILGGGSARGDEIITILRFLGQIFNNLVFLSLKLGSNQAQICAPVRSPLAFSQSYMKSVFNTGFNFGGGGRTGETNPFHQSQLHQSQNSNHIQNGCLHTDLCLAL